MMKKKLGETNNSRGDGRHGCDESTTVITSRHDDGCDESIYDDTEEAKGAVLAWAGYSRYDMEHDIY